MSTIQHRLATAILVTVAVAGLVVFALNATSCGGKETVEDSATSATDVSEMTITARDFTFDAPSRVTAGPVATTLVNAGTEPHHAIAMRLNDGVSIAQFMDALPGGPEAVLAVATVQGGPDTAAPGASAGVTLDLRAGNYVFLCLVQDSEGVPHAAKGMAHAVEVAPGATGATAYAPSSGPRVTIKDFTFDLPETVPGGRQTWEVVNAGPQPHELALYTLLPGKSFEDLAVYAANPVGPRPVARASGVQLMTAGERAWLDLDLQPGGYALVCTIPDPATGKEHVDLGMLSTFTVAARQASMTPSGADGAGLPSWQINQMTARHPEP
jgi:hypothetical protein